MKKLLSLIIVAVMMLSIALTGMISASALPDYTEGADLSYYDEIMPYYYPEIFAGTGYEPFYYYMLYAHDIGQEEPEYIVFIAKHGGGDTAIAKDVFGDYYVSNSYLDFPYELAHYVFVPAEKKVYTLREAWDREDLDITAAFESGNVGKYIGKEPQYRYLEQFKAEYIDSGMYFPDMIYEEVYNQYAFGKRPYQIDWVLVHAYLNGPLPRECYAVLGDRVSLAGDCVPFAVNYAVYDVNTKEFTDICDIEDLSAYNGLEKQIEKLGIGVPIGDADGDKVLTVTDATYIQRVAAKLCEYDDIDDLSGRYQVNSELKFISDFNRDGQRNVMDATAIQRKLVE